MTLYELHDPTDVRETDIVVGVDGSPSSTAALRWALAQAKLASVRVQAVAAWEYPTYYGWAGAYPYEDVSVSTGKYLDETVHRVIDAEKADVEVLQSVVPGNPAQALIDASAHAALLVVGSRGHGAFAGALLGSVSQHCVHHAHCPVVVVRGKS
ncbi:universal stress protein [Winogradskya consettensis]|uniref:Universal stress protein n=1 Tax=Winogradskya consettensis TaxID=113560 RepID=A0A919W1Q0_9ACTN|nr:universal stress protein [Actinoplanes consettensis]GIM76708.1 universal stress protein [Actinoplanes consettensis]